MAWNAATRRRRSASCGQTITLTNPAFVCRCATTLGGEQFEHTIPADEHDFVFPPAEAPIPSGPECTARQSYTIEVFVIRPAGDEPVGAVGGVAECGGPQ